MYSFLVQHCCLVTQSCPTLCGPVGLQHARLPCPSLSPWSLLKIMSIELLMPSNHLISCCPLFILLSIFPSIRVFSNELALHIRWPQYWSFSFSPSNECSGLISFRINCCDSIFIYISKLSPCRVITVVLHSLCYMFHLCDLSILQDCFLFSFLAIYPVSHSCHATY